MIKPSNILQSGDRRLRLESKMLTLDQLSNKSTKVLIKLLHKSLSVHGDGVAIAAPQIGANLKIFVLSPKIIGTTIGDKNLVFINPRITRKSRKKIIYDEGCLSVRWMYGKISRYEKVTVEALDENGAVFSRNATGLLAEIFQHEIDHLNGILFTDSATDLRKVVFTDSTKNE